MQREKGLTGGDAQISPEPQVLGVPLGAHARTLVAQLTGGTLGVCADGLQLPVPTEGEKRLT